eukprot:4759156-Amphidinium_carterae.2
MTGVFMFRKSAGLISDPVDLVKWDSGMSRVRGLASAVNVYLASYTKFSGRNAPTTAKGLWASSYVAVALKRHLPGHFKSI